MRGPDSHILPRDVSDPERAHRKQHCQQGRSRFDLLRTLVQADSIGLRDVLAARSEKKRQLK